MFRTSDTQSSETKSSETKSYPQSRRSLPLSAPERRLLLAVVWGEPLLQAAQRLGLSPGEARQMLSRLQQRAGVASRQALIARTVAHRWAD